MEKQDKIKSSVFTKLKLRMLKESASEGHRYECFCSSNQALKFWLKVCEESLGSNHLEFDPVSQPTV